MCVCVGSGCFRTLLAAEIMMILAEDVHFSTKTLKAVFPNVGVEVLLNAKWRL